ncbi:MAG TPA: N-acetyltransferase [Anaerolineae bacterium]|nr:GNAT family N-acetyltransferase [Caldilineae bacterium]HID34676.1 N-acetyltransferase [Anaerolineae bacterium]HIQ11419.1 N-acetyltransferase [Caldilineales bacterium]
MIPSPDMMRQPTLETSRLILRPFREADIPDIVALLQERDIHRMITDIPYPYSEQNAREWLAHQQKSREEGTEYTFAVMRKEDQQLLGAIKIRPDMRHRKAEVGYWIGKPYWGRGYATETLKAILRFGFETLALNRVYATHFAENPASGRVMQKAGMTYEGAMRQAIYKNGHFRDSLIYAILREEWEASSPVTARSGRNRIPRRAAAGPNRAHRHPRPAPGTRH